MEFEKMRVPLSAIRPSGQNPRKDFGDIAALARAIEATGGEPVNPPVVVEDGNVYRIVDGERRYRALKALHPEGDREVTVLCAASMDGANELTAMLATDDKRQLTDAERARGVQQMLVLGVDEQRIERASRATAAQVRAAKRLAGRVPEGVQVTLDQLEAAASFEDEEDVEAVLGAEDWRERAERIRRRHDREDALARDYDALGDAGIPALKERPEGASWVGWSRLGEVAGQIAEDEEIAGASAAVLEGSGWTFFGEADAEQEKSEEELRAEAEREREDAQLTDLYRRMVAWIAEGFYTLDIGLLDAVRAWRAGHDGLPLSESRLGDGGWDERREAALRLRDDLVVGPAGDSTPSGFEVARYLLEVAGDMASLRSGFTGDDDEAWLRHLLLMEGAGFKTGEGDRWLRDRIQAELWNEGEDEDDE